MIGYVGRLEGIAGVVDRGDPKVEDIVAALVAVRAQLHAALIELDRLATAGVQMSDEEREAVAAAVLVVRRYRERSLDALLRWMRDVKSGEESWIVARSIPGEQRADAWYVKSMPAHLARKFTH